MLRCLLFLLLLSGLALPAVRAQACDSPAASAHMAMAHAGMSGDSMAPMAMASHHAPAQPAPAPGLDHHDCIGCIAPLAIALYRPVSAPDFMAARHDPIRNSRDRARLVPAPEPPPPRTSV